MKMRGSFLRRTFKYILSSAGGIASRSNIDEITIERTRRSYRDRVSIYQKRLATDVSSGARRYQLRKSIVASGDGVPGNERSQYLPVNKPGRPDFGLPATGQL